ncbi:hypothetical protein CUMW_216820, partial [Citrus unshiu]
MLSKGCDEGHSLLDSNHTPYNLDSLKGRVDGDFFQALNNPPTHLHQHILRKVDSSSFSGMGTEHLLEAVVSRANSVSKQISDDNVSCRTTVTQISISSIPTISPSSGQGESVKPDGSVSTANSKKNDETTKSNRKRLKPGENPRPRPKDHQMIQGSAKEAQEIVPKGKKRTWTSRTYHQAHAVLAECDKARCRSSSRREVAFVGRTCASRF